MCRQPAQDLGAHQGGHATTCFLEWFLEGACKGFEQGRAEFSQETSCILPSCSRPARLAGICLPSYLLMLVFGLKQLIMHYGSVPFPEQICGESILVLDVHCLKSRSGWG